MSSNSDPEVELPPRKNPTPTKISRQNLTPLQTLLQMGFSRKRAEKALVATGSRGVQIASDWLLSHVNDPDLDVESVREFVVYLCPVSGPLQKQLEIFWNASKIQIGWNGAHNSFPHISLTSFPCPNEKVEDVLNVIGKVCMNFRPDFSSSAINLEKYQSPNFLGLFVGKKEEILLRSLAQEIQQQLNLQCQVSAEVNSKSFQISLAYQFQSQHYAGLEDLASAVDPGAESEWEVRVFSYDNRYKLHEVHKVNYAHIPRENDEIELRIGDLIYVLPEEFAKTNDGWILGDSWLTGCQGYLPKNYISRTSETNAWTNHLSVLMSKNYKSSCSSSLERFMHTPEKATSVHKSSRSKKDSVEIKEKVRVAADTQPRQVYVCRHGERVDFTFGSWIPFCFDEKGNYTQKDLNMPKKLPQRNSGPEGFARDCPLTVYGDIQATLVGGALKVASVQLTHAFSSPSLRCVQTCHGILSGMGLEKKIKISIEPGLFEWLAWYSNAMPDWMSNSELLAAGYNIETGYKPYISAEELQDKETPEEYYTRNFFVTQCILQSTEEQGGNVLMVGHAATLDVCTRQITGKGPRNINDMMSIVRKIPYCSLAVIEEEVLAKRKKSTWKLIPPPVPPLTHSSNARFDWNILSDEISSKPKNNKA